jgi:antitoxin VapB
MKSGAVFKSNTSQAVRLPKEVALPDSVKRVDIIPMGRGRLIVPVGEGWNSWFDEPGVTSDFMNLRDQPSEQTRESL